MKNNKNIVVVIPSYNEVKNIEILIKGIFKSVPSFAPMSTVTIFSLDFFTLFRDF